MHLEIFFSKSNHDIIVISYHGNDGQDRWFSVFCVLQQCNLGSFILVDVLYSVFTFSPAGVHTTTNTSYHLWEQRINKGNKTLN